MLEAVRIYLFVFGAATIAGGVVGYVKAKSTASIVAGSISGGLLLVSGYLSGRGGSYGPGLGLLVSTMLTGRFAGAFRQSRKVMPAGLMTALGLIGMALTVVVLVGTTR